MSLEMFATRVGAWLREAVICLVLSTFINHANGDPIVGGFAVETYASIIDPVKLSFDPSGILYVGRDASGSGGQFLTPVKIHRVVQVDGSTIVSEFGTSTIPDPDALVVDVLGTVSGSPLSVLVGGNVESPNVLRISAVLTDQSIQTIKETKTPGDPDEMVFDNSGRLLFAAGFGAMGKGVYTIMNDNSIVRVFELASVARSLAIDTQNRIFTSSDDGRIRVHSSSGLSINDNFVQLDGAAVIEFGPGGVWGQDLYALEPSSGALYRIDNTTNPQQQGNTHQVGTGFATTNASLTDIAFGPDGALYVSDFPQDRILRISLGCLNPPCVPASSSWGVISLVLMVLTVASAIMKYRNSASAKPIRR